MANSITPVRQRGRAAAVVLAVVAAATVAAVAGYLAGRQAGHPKPPASAEAAKAPAAGDAKGERKVLYYRNPMGLPDTSPVPKKDSMGMDYIPVYEGEDTSGLAVASGKLQALGVRVAAVERRALDRMVRASGRIEADERRLTVVTAKFDGYVERLHVNATGQSVARGAPLLEAFSPDLLAAQREYQVAMQALARLKEADPEARAGMQRLADAALARLRLWDIGDDDLAKLAASGEARRTLSLRAPGSGVVTERKVAQGPPFIAAAQVVVPASAVIYSGARRVVIVDLGAGRFEPRDVTLGERGEQYVSILKGVKEGESVVVAANFLLDAESNLRAALDGLKGGSNASPDKRPVVHEAVGTLDDVDGKSGVLLITHEPVASLNWPTMTMEFVPANEAVARAARPGEAIRFEFVERKPGEWVVTRMDKRAARSGDSAGDRKGPQPPAGARK